MFRNWWFTGDGWNEIVSQNIFNNTHIILIVRAIEEGHLLLKPWICTEEAAWGCISAIFDNNNNNDNDVDNNSGNNNNNNNSNNINNNK